MTLPGPIIRQESQVVPRTAPTDTGTLFIAAKTTGSASSVAQLVETPLQLQAKIGARTAGNAALYDAVEAAMMHGARRVYFATTPNTGTVEEFAAALALFERELGPGQVMAVGYAADDEAAINEELLVHARENNRRALLQITGEDRAAIVAAAGALRSLGELSKYGAAFCQKAIIEGIPALGVASREVPWTAVQAGLIARIDAQGNPNVPAAGEAGIAQKVLGLDVEYRDPADREALADAGVNVVRVIVQGDFPRTYDYVTLADPAKYPEHWMFNNVRLDMAIAAQAEAIAERFQFKVLDGNRVTVSQYGGELAAMLAEYYRMGALFGASAEEAFTVDVSEAVNPVENLAQGKLSAVLGVKRSPFARQAEVVVVTAPITAQLTA